MYKSFAALYDRLMEDVPYDDWLNYFCEKKLQYDIKGNDILDLACGTGELAIRLANKNMSVVGVDLSPHMLSIAQSKIDQSAHSITLIEQDMSKLEGLGSFDIVTIFCDSLNYLRSKADVEETFLRVYEHLRPGGLLLFDVHSPYKIDKLFAGKTFGLNDEDISYVWHCFPGEDKYSVEHDLSFFIYDEETNKYDRFDEFHQQRTYAVDEYIAMLKKANFSVEEVTGDFTNKKYDEKSERLFFVAKKQAEK